MTRNGLIRIDKLKPSELLLFIISVLTGFEPFINILKTTGLTSNLPKCVKAILLAFCSYPNAYYFLLYSLSFSLLYIYVAKMSEKSLDTSFDRNNITVEESSKREKVVESFLDKIRLFMIEKIRSILLKNMQIAYLDSFEWREYWKDMDSRYSKDVIRVGKGEPLNEVTQYQFASDGSKIYRKIAPILPKQSDGTFGPEEELELTWRDARIIIAVSPKKIFWLILHIWKKSFF